jgi:hypothetical protein
MSVAPNKLAFVLILKGNIAMLVLYVKRLLIIFRTTIAMYDAKLLNFVWQVLLYQRQVFVFITC